MLSLCDVVVAVAHFHDPQPCRLLAVPRQDGVAVLDDVDNVAREYCNATVIAELSDRYQRLLHGREDVCFAGFLWETWDDQAGGVT